MLETVWFILWGVLWAVYFMLDGFDFGVGMLTKALGKNKTDIDIMFRSTGPFWDGNEVWLIAAGGITFAAFPTTYAVMFSALYSPLMLILFTLIIRGVCFEFRGKIENPTWDNIVEWCMVICSFLPALLFGVAFANIFAGVPIDAKGILQGNIISLLTPYGIAGGLLFVCFFLLHGALWLAIKSEGDIHERAVSVADKSWYILFILAVVFLVFSKLFTDIYANYMATPILFLIPILCVAGLIMIKIFMKSKSYWKAWFASCLSIVTATFFGLAGIFPNLLPSSIDPSYSMTIYNSSSSPLTLKIMLGVVIVFVPLVIAYQTWAYFLFKDKIKTEDLTDGGY